MSDYIGKVGELVPFERVSEVSTSLDSPYTIRHTRNRSWGFVNNPTPGTNRRTWNLVITASSYDLGRLNQFMQGAGGYAPLVYIPEHAQLSNTLTPAQSALTEAGIPTGGSVLTEQGYAPVSLVNPHSDNTPTVLALGLPVIADKTFTASVFASGEAPVMEVAFFTAAGRGISTRGATYRKVEQGALQLLTYTGKTPVNAAYATMRIRSHTMVAMPALTYTDKQVPWTSGLSSKSVLITSLEYKPSLLQECSRDIFSEASITIEELS